MKGKERPRWWWERLALIRRLDRARKDRVVEAPAHYTRAEDRHGDLEADGEECLTEPLSEE
jgi:hypothetical protein